jgi:hypothetical protein
MHEGDDAVGDLAMARGDVAVDYEMALKRSCKSQCFPYVFR